MDILIRKIAKEKLLINKQKGSTKENKLVH